MNRNRYEPEPVFLIKICQKIDFFDFYRSKVWVRNPECVKMIQKVGWGTKGNVFFCDFDVLLAPVAFSPAFEHQSEGNLYTRTLEVDGVVRPYSDLIVWTSQFGYVYLPSTVVPVGFTKDGSPVGIQVVGPYLGDRTTLEYARHIERLRGGYKVPPIAKL